MITRSDVQIYGGSPTAFDSLRSSQMDASIDFPMDHSELPFAEAKYPTSIYDLSQDDSNAKDENVSLTLSKIVNEMLSPPNTLSSHAFLHSSGAQIGAYEACGLRDSGLSSKKYRHANTPRPSINPEKLMSSVKDEFYIKDEFDIKDELDSFPYSHPDTPSETATAAAPHFASSLCQIENLPYASSPYPEVKAEESDLSQGTPTCLEHRNYDTSSLMYATDDMTTFSGLVNCDEVLRTHKRKESFGDRGGTFVCCYRSGSSSSSSDEGRGSSHLEQAELKEKEDRDENFFLPQDTQMDDTESRKGKISGLQRRALDSIFSVTDRPSRGLVLHIAGELCLHHITVKNFFSNGRRRLRRAAARLSDPERTRRENQKRKEKRRLAALAAAASAANGDKGGTSSSKGSSEGGGDSQSPRDPPVLSPERRALMEKLAVKVQRSVAQKGLAANAGEAAAAAAAALSASSSSCLASPSAYSQSAFPSPRLDSPRPTQLHSNPLALNEPSKPFALHRGEHSYLNQNGEEFGAIFSYSESEPMSSYDSSPDQNSVNLYSSSEQDNSNTYGLASQEGPYSPTSWQTLLHT